MENLDKLWILSAELEGLLLVLKSKHGVEAKPYRALIIDKIKKINELFEMDESDDVDETAEAESALFEQEENADMDSVVIENEPDPEPQAEPEPQVEPEPVIEPEPQVEPEPVVENENPEAEAEEIVTEAEVQEEKEDFTEEKPVEPVSVSSEPETAPVVEPVAEEKAAEEPVRVEEKLARHTSRDIYKAFTINDKFRFRRTLFGNNSSQYNEALELISQMDSYDETADYFFTQYGWNPEDENVKSFMQIVKTHFEA